VASNVAVGRSAPGRAGAVVGVLTRSRELTLAAVVVVLSVLVWIQAPNFLTLDNLQPVTTLAAIIAIAAVGEALVILTKNIDLSVESTIGIVAFVVGLLLKQGGFSMPEAWALGVGLGLVLGMCNGVIVAVFKVPSIVATLGTLSIFRGLCFFVANGTEINLNDLPDGYTNAASQAFFGIPLFVLIAVLVIAIAALVLRYTTVGRLFYAVGSNAEAAATIGVRSQLTVFLAFSLCGMLAGVAGVLWGINYGALYANSASGQSLAVIAAVVVGGVSISGGSGTVVGAALGALFLGLIYNALNLLLLPQEWLQLIYGAVILVAVSADALIQVRTQRAKARSRIR
jgi:rhamnose transport system permease protein